MALTAYCKKCAREVEPGERCPYCGSRLGKNAAHAAWCVERTPVRDWMSWNALMRILLPAALFILDGVNAEDEPLFCDTVNEVLADVAQNGFS